jgi:glycosyltransferase involved in cell wall biosynthesis
VRIAYAGKIAFKKGVSCLIAALDRTQLSPRDTRVDLAGGYSVQGEYDLIAAQAATSRWDVRLAGKLPQPELARLYNAADIFVLPSFFEGLPLVVVEALACGCAVVVTDLPGIRPWLAEHVPDAPVLYVAPPRMRDTDEPLPEDLPAFEERLAAAIDQAAAAPVAACDTSSLSWDALAQKLVE